MHRKSALTASRRRPRRSAAEATARAAVLAGLPALGITAVAAASASSLAIWADLLLTVIDMAALVGAWTVARRGGRIGATTRMAAAEARILVFTSLCMAASLLLVLGLAVARLSDGGAPVDGAGLWLALAQNGVYAAVNGWILLSWRRRLRAAPGALVQAQVRLFSDKLSSNVILLAALGATLAFPGSAFATLIDAATGVFLAAISAWWLLPVIVLAWRRRLRPAAG